MRWLYRSRRKERSYLHGMAEVCEIGEVAEVFLALLPKDWEGAGCLMWLLRWHSTEEWGRHSCFQEGAVHMCRLNKDTAQSRLMPKVF